MVFITKAGTGLGQYDLNITTGGSVVKRDNATVDPIETGDYKATWTLFAPLSWKPGNYTVGVGMSLPPLPFSSLFHVYAIHPLSPLFFLLPPLILCHMFNRHPLHLLPPSLSLCAAMCYGKCWSHVPHSEVYSSAKANFNISGSG